MWLIVLLVSGFGFVLVGGCLSFVRVFACRLWFLMGALRVPLRFVGLCLFCGFTIFVLLPGSLGL